ncbi:MAG: methyltransferase domain-containing protein [Bacillaceae bacterium]|nr:methyltransferase domain-containing protein [Bacillaceae bacterium]
MAIVQLKSTNPHFSFLIRKNPASGMMLRTVRQGIAFGWYSDDQTYNIYFKDADNEISYKQHKEESFEYLNVSRYNTPLFPLNAMTEFFNSTIKNRYDNDLEGYENELFVNMVHITLPRYIDFFSKHFEDFSIEMIHQSHKSYSIKIKTNKSIYDLLNTANLLFLFLSLIGNEYLDVTDSLIEKYVNQIKVLDAPFFIRYLFARNILTSRKLFSKFKESLEETQRYDINFSYGHTAHQRREAIKKLLPFNKPIVDVGCGEGYYAFLFSESIGDKYYYAIDIDEDIIRSLDARIKKRGIENILTYGSIEDFIEDYNGELVDVILTEVIEHMEKDEAKKLILTILDDIHFESIIITTPNHDFNKYYSLDEYRHEDHKWEMGTNEFKQWISEIFDERDFEIHHLSIGDCVDGVYTTQGVLVKARGEK